MFPISLHLHHQSHVSQRLLKGPSLLRKCSVQPSGNNLTHTGARSIGIRNHGRHLTRHAGTGQEKKQQMQHNGARLLTHLLLLTGPRDLPRLQYSNAIIWTSSMTGMVCERLHLTKQFVTSLGSACCARGCVLLLRLGILCLMCLGVLASLCLSLFFLSLLSVPLSVTICVYTSP